MAPNFKIGMNKEQAIRAAQLDCCLEERPQKQVKNVVSLWFKTDKNGIIDDEKELKSLASLFYNEFEMSDYVYEKNKEIKNPALNTLAQFGSFVKGVTRHAAYNTAGLAATFVQK